jgi:hypothetical protein
MSTRACGARESRLLGSKLNRYREIVLDMGLETQFRPKAMRFLSLSKPDV